jgi:hypothetical protein
MIHGPAVGCAGSETCGAMLLGLAFGYLHMGCIVGYFGGA